MLGDDVKRFISMMSMSGLISEAKLTSNAPAASAVNSGAPISAITTSSRTMKVILFYATMFQLLFHLI